MHEIKRFTIFVGSPGDVAEERTIVEEVADELNRSIGRSNGVDLAVIRWEKDSVPDYGAHPQELINRQLATMSHHDLFVGIMWNRFGTPTEKAGSGTEEEFDRAVASYEAFGTPRIMLYFSQRPSNLRTTAELSQKAAVLAFRERVQDKALTVDYPSAEAFRTMLRSHLTKLILTDMSPSAVRQPPISEPKSELQHPLQDIKAEPTRWVLLGQGFYVVSEVRERSEQLYVSVLPQNSEEDELLRSLSKARQAVQFAYQQIGGIAEIRSTERMSANGKDGWTFELVLQDANSYTTEMGFNGRSPREMAEMRARLMLLGELPPATDPFLLSFLSGFDRSSLPQAIFRTLYQEQIQQTAHFLAWARLLAVFFLKSTNTVAQIVRLDLGPIEQGQLKVNFVGVRKKFYANVEADTLTVTGPCPLT
jgi:hypothetical protein